MELTDKRAVAIIFGAVLSPFLVCLLLLLFGTDVGTVLLLAAIYVVFGLVSVLIVGWVLSGLTKNHPKAQLLSVISYCLPAIVIDLGIIGIALSS